jgi:hypothetical protein
MYLFENNKSTLQPSLTSSMQFLYKDSDKTSGWRDFVPFYIPDPAHPSHKHAGAKSPSIAPTGQTPSSFSEIKVPKLK